MARENHVLIPLYKYHQFTAQFNLKDIFFNLKKSQFVVKMVKNHLVLCETISSRTICIINTNMILTLARSYVKREFVSSVSWLLYRLDNVSLTVSVKWDDCFVLRISTVTYLLDFLELKKHPSNWISCVAQHNSNRIKTTTAHFISEMRDK